MKSVSIDCSRIHDWDSFHQVFSEAFGFPAFYGRNMNAWTDCLTHLDDPESGMTSIHVAKGEILVPGLLNVAEFRQSHAELYEAVIECSAFVNYRRIEISEEPVLALSFFS